jgi:hypothetical protein
MSQNDVNFIVCKDTQRYKNQNIIVTKTRHSYLTSFLTVGRYVRISLGNGFRYMVFILVS